MHARTYMRICMCAGRQVGGRVPRVRFTGKIVVPACLLFLHFWTEGYRTREKSQPTLSPKWHDATSSIVLPVSTMIVPFPAKFEDMKRAVPPSCIWIPLVSWKLILLCLSTIRSVGLREAYTAALAAFGPFTTLSINTSFAPDPKSIFKVVAVRVAFC